MNSLKQNIDPLVARTLATRPTMRLCLLIWLTGWFSTGVSICIGQSVTARILSSDYNVFDEGSLGFGALRTRQFVFTPPNGVQILSPCIGDGWIRYDLAAGASPPYPLNLCDTVMGWPAPQTTTITCPDNSMVTGTVDVGVDFTAYLWVRQESTLAQDLNDQIAVLGDPSDTPMSYSFPGGDSSVVMQIQGGQFGGKSVTLKATMAYGSGASTNNTANYAEAWGEFFLAVAWGNDPWGNQEFLMIQIAVHATVDAPPCLNLSDVSSQFLDFADPLSYAQNVVLDIETQVEGGSAYIQGAIPDLLYLYDFSANSTIPLTNTVPPSALVPSVTSWTNFDPYINQYDAGRAFNLPVVDGAAGGAACGPTSLTMALNAAGHPQLSCLPVYNGTMKGTLFDAEKAVDWLNSQGIAAYEIYADATPKTPISFNRAWAEVDAQLTARQPVVFRTDLSGTFLVGDGHMILLLGIGHSKDIASLYGDNGDYYIVADPAGDWYADQTVGSYAFVERLRQNYLGVNYAGWGAIYPVEFLRNHIYDLTNSGNRITAVTLGNPPAPFARVRAHSPVTLLVTDPFGNQTGFLPDGTFIKEIPDSGFVPDVEDGDDQLSVVDPDGPKTILIENPVAGSYVVNVLGTNTGPFTLDWEEIGGDGSLLGSATFIGNATPGFQQNYSLVAVPTGPPPLHIATEGNLLLLSWPTNYAGFFLQTTADLSPTTWIPATNGVVVAGGLNTVSTPMSSPRQFFRLANQ